MSEPVNLEAVMAKLEEISDELRKLRVTNAKGEVWLDIREVCALTRLSQREIYRRVEEDKFPPASSIAGLRRHVWKRETVQKWMKQNLQQRAKAS